MSEREVRVIENRTRWWPDLPELWRARHIVYMWAVRTIRARYKQALLGFLWALLTPLAFTAIFVWFLQNASVSAFGSAQAIPSAFAGMIAWQFFARGVLDGATSLAGNANIISKVYFPRAALPLAAVVSAFFDFAVAFVLMIVLLLWYSLPLEPKAILAPVFVVWIGLIVFGLILILSAIDALFRDLRHALPTLLQIGMLVTPVAYASSSFVPKDWLWLYSLNPLVAPIEGFRWALIEGASPVSYYAATASLIATGTILAVGLVTFSMLEKSVVDLA